MQCPSCKEQIDDDSCYCDQCGAQILVCSVCGRPGRGKRCIFDGKELVPAGGNAPQASAVQQVQTSAQSGSAGTDGKIKFTSQMHGITIEAGDGDVIGRKSGSFTNVFGRFNYVSGMHCRIIKNAGGWHIQDLGSTNGTFYNGNRLAPNMIYPVASNTTVKIADIELLITYGTPEGGTVRI